MVHIQFKHSFYISILCRCREKGPHLGLSGICLLPVTETVCDVTGQGKNTYSLKILQSFGKPDKGLARRQTTQYISKSFEHPELT